VGGEDEGRRREGGGRIEGRGRGMEEGEEQGREIDEDWGREERGREHRREGDQGRRREERGRKSLGIPSKPSSCPLHSPLVQSQPSCVASVL
jgi:hypothetical protein